MTETREWAVETAGVKDLGSEGSGARNDLSSILHSA